MDDNYLYNNQNSYSGYNEYSQSKVYNNPPKIIQPSQNFKSTIFPSSDVNPVNAPYPNYMFNGKGVNSSSNFMSSNYMPAFNPNGYQNSGNSGIIPNESGAFSRVLSREPINNMNNPMNMNMNFIQKPNNMSQNERFQDTYNDNYQLNQLNQMNPISPMNQINPISPMNQTQVNNNLLRDNGKQSDVVNKMSLQNYAELSDEELSRHCHVLAKDQGGCRFLQKKIEESREFTNKHIFPNVCCLIIN